MTANTRNMFGLPDRFPLMVCQPTVNDYLRQAITVNWQQTAFADLHGVSYTFADVAARIMRLHILFDRTGIAKGDKIALCAKNSANWAVSALAVLTYGAVAVPILHDFDVETIRHLVTFSDSRLLFADTQTIKRIGDQPLTGVDCIVDLTDFSITGTDTPVTRADIDTAFAARYAGGLTPGDVVFADVPADAVSLINFTAGSTGFSKGVMLSERALWSNLQFCIDGLTFLLPGDTMLSMLPLAHMFGFMIEMVHPFAKGCATTFLNRTPTPRILLEAFALVRPKLIITVPLVIEKIVRTRVFPVLQRPAMRLLTAIPGIRSLVYSRIRSQLIKAFGGEVRQIIVGGAPLSPEVESFLRRIHFPLTVGYGMTECGPLISYCEWSTQRPGSCGRPADRMQVRVDSPDPANIPGTLWVHGDNVMDGYYKNPEATKAVMHDGWMNTGDICTVDADGYIYIRGRDKNMILGPSGQNIYPEEIEQRLNNMPYVAESVVIDGGDGRLHALIHPDFDAARHDGITDPANIRERMERDIKELNPRLPAYSRISTFEVHDTEFEKTPKKSIKRYLYFKKQ